MAQEPDQLRREIEETRARMTRDVDLLVVRENTEGVYVGAGGTVHRGGPAEAATETSIETRAGVER